MISLGYEVLTGNYATATQNGFEGATDLAPALAVLLVSGVLAFTAAAKAVGPVARVLKTVLWLSVAALFALLAVGVGVTIAFDYLT